MTFAEQLWHQLGVTPAQALGVVIATIVLYSTFAVILRWTGMRLYANRSSTGLAVVLVLGAITGRGMLGNSPTLLGALIALGTLVLLERWVGMRFILSKRARPRRAVVVLAGGHFRPEVLRHYHLTQGQVLAALRQAQIKRMSEVWAVVLEPSGALSVLREPIDPRLLSGVKGREFLSWPAPMVRRTGASAADRPSTEPGPTPTANAQ